MGGVYQLSEVGWGDLSPTRNEKSPRMRAFFWVEHRRRRRNVRGGRCLGQLAGPIFQPPGCAMAAWPVTGLQAGRCALAVTFVFGPGGQNCGGIHTVFTPCAGLTAGSWRPLTYQDASACIKSRKVYLTPKRHLPPWARAPAPCMHAGAAHQFGEVPRRPGQVAHAGMRQRRAAKNPLGAGFRGRRVQSRRNGHGLQMECAPSAKPVLTAWPATGLQACGGALAVAFVFGPGGQNCGGVHTVNSLCEYNAACAAVVDSAGTKKCRFFCATHQPCAAREAYPKEEHPAQIHKRIQGVFYWKAP